MFTIKENGMVDGRILHQSTNVKTPFDKWVKRCIDICDLQKSKDFSTFLSKSTGGRPRKEYEFTTDAAKEMCIVSATSKAKEIRQYLINLDKQKESKELLSHGEVIMLSRLKAFFKYIENQKEIYHRHKDYFAANYEGNKNKYAEFNIWRNEILQIDPKDLDRQIQEYCAQNNKKLPKIKDKSSKIRFLNEYNALRHAVWDFLKMQGKINAEKLSNLVKRMAEVENLQTYDRNENNLFRNKENINIQLNSNNHSK